LEKLGLVTHLLDDVVRRVTFGARNSKIETIGAIMRDSASRCERGPMLFLTGVKFNSTDPIDVRIAVGDDLLASAPEARLGQYHRLRGALEFFAAFGLFSQAPVAFVPPQGPAVPLAPLPARRPDIPLTPDKPRSQHADSPADRTLPHFLPLDWLLCELP